MPGERTEEQAAREQLREFRRIVANAVGALRSQEIRDTFASISIEELMDQHVSALIDSNDANNPSRLQRVRRIREDLANTIEAMKNTPPSAFRRTDSRNDVNTSPEGT